MSLKKMKKKEKTQTNIEPTDQADSSASEVCSDSDSFTCHPDISLSNPIIEDELQKRSLLPSHSYSDTEKKKKKINKTKRLIKTNGLAGIAKVFREDIATESFKRFKEKGIKIKNNMRNSPWILSLCVSLASFGVMWGGFFSALAYMFSFRFITAIIKLYQVLFAMVCLSLECSRYIPGFQFNSTLHQLAPIVRLNIGRGCLQLITGILAMDHHPGIVEWLPGVILTTSGLINLVLGIRCALQMRKLMLLYQTSVNDEGETEGEFRNVFRDSKLQQSPEIVFRELHTKFKELDTDGDGKLSREELAASCKALNFNIDDAKLTMIFQILDSGSKGYIDLADFEAWWYREKSLLTAMLV
jgi:hypothetical protein